MDPSRQRDKDKEGNKSRGQQVPGSTTSLGKRRRRPGASEQGARAQQQQQAQQRQRSPGARAAASPAPNNNNTAAAAATATTTSTMSNPTSAEYGSQASPLRVPAKPEELIKVTIVGAGGGIGQPLALLLMLHSEYVQHLALYDLVHVRGVQADLSHVDRQCKVTSHLGPDELPEAVRGAKVIVIPAGLAQKPGMSRDDLFGSNAKIAMSIAKVCAQVAPDAHIALISNPVNSLTPLFCEVYNRVLGHHHHPAQQQQQQQQAQNEPAAKEPAPKQAFHDSYRRIFGVTTLDVVRASSLTAKSALFKPDSPSGLFKDPTQVTMPVVGGHAGKTIIPLLSQAVPKLDRERLVKDKSTISALVDSIQQAGIEVLNAKKGAGSATLAMAYAACRFTISLLRAQLGEQNIVECAYVRHHQPLVHDLDYFAAPLVLGKDGYTKCLGLGKLLPQEQQMIDEAAKELKASIVKGEDFAREHS